MSTIVRTVESDPIRLYVDDDGGLLRIEGTRQEPIQVVSDMPGPPGLNGWTAVTSIVPDGERRVKRITDWFGGTGAKPATGDYLGPIGLVATAGEASDVRGPVGGAGDDGDPGDQGEKGWSRVDAIETDGARRVYRVSAWVGGEGDPPAGVGQYVGPGGLVGTAGEATDIRGPEGEKGDTGDITPAAQTALDAATTQNTNTVNAANALLASTSALALLIAAYATTAQTAQAGAVNVAQTNLSAAARAIALATDVVATFVYDTTKDTDGGAWRDKVAHTSWMNETLGTATRGTRAQFPSKALIVARTTVGSGIAIYDMDDPACPLWKSWSTSAENVPYGSPTSLSAAQGTLLFGGGGNGYSFVDLIGDQPYLRNSVALYAYKGNVSQLGQALSFVQFAAGGIASPTVNSITATILPHTPTNPLRCDLPTPVIAVATAGGMSVIRWDGFVSSSTASAMQAVAVSFLPTGELFYSRGADRQIGFIKPADYLTNNLSRQVLTVFNNPAHTDAAAGLPRLTASPQGPIYGTGSGLCRTLFERTNPAASLAAYINDKYNTGYINGDSKLALAESSADLSSLTGITYGPELVTRGSFDKVTGWTAYIYSSSTPAKLSVTTGGRLRVEQVAGGYFSGAQYALAGLTVGRSYRVLVDNFGAAFAILSESTYLHVISVQKALASTGDAQEFQFTAQQTTHYLSFAFDGNPAAGTSFEIDNVSVKEVIGELVTNGKLDQGTTGWANGTGSETVAVVGGRLRVTRNGAESWPRAKQTINGLTVNRYYLFKATINAVQSAGNTAFLTFGTEKVAPAVTTGFASTDYVFLHKATATSHDLEVGFKGVSGSAGDYVEFDNISVMPLAGIDKAPLANDDFTSSVGTWHASDQFGPTNITVEAVGGRLRVRTTDGSPAYPRGDKTVSGLVVGRTYEVSFAFNRVDADLNWGMKTDNWYGTLLQNEVVSASGVVKKTFTATTTAVWFSLTMNLGTMLEIDNFVVREVDTGLGANLVLNGGFDADTNWTKGTGWTITGGRAVKAPGSASDLVSAAAVVTANKVYRVAVDVSSYTAGILTLYAGFGAGGGNVSGSITAAGRHNFYLIGRGDLNVYAGANAAFDGSIDNIEVREVTDSLIYNGTFDTDTAGWEMITVGTGTAGWNAGGMRLVGVDASNYGQGRLPLNNLVAGRAYRIAGTTTGAGYFDGPFGGQNVNGAFSRDFVASSSAAQFNFLPSGYVGTVTFDNIVLTEVPAELVANGTFNVGGGDNIEAWGEVVTGTGTITFANGVATLTGGTGTAAINQTITGLTIGQPHRHRVTVSTAPVTVTVAGLNQSLAVGAQTVEFVPTATSHVLTFAVGAGVTAGVTAVSVQAVQGLAYANDFSQYANTAALLADGWQESAPSVNMVELANGALSVGSSVTTGFAERQITTVPGATYRLTADISMSVNGQWILRAATAAGGTGNLASNAASTPTSGASIVFTATAATTWLSFWRNAVNNKTEFDNIRITRIASDRSVAANHPVVYGTVTRSVVATGAELAGYGGFSASNFLEYTGTAFDPGAGDFVAAAWVLPNTTGLYQSIFAYGNGSGNGHVLRLNGVGSNLAFSANGVAGVANFGSYSANAPLLAIFQRRNGVVMAHVNGVKQGTGLSYASSMTLAGATLRIGNAGNLGGLFGVDAFAGGLIVLPRMSIGTSMSDDQIRAMYEAERPMMQANAKCLLLGSANVQGLAADNDNGKVFAATAVGTNEFTGLVRTGYRQSTTGVNRLTGGTWRLAGWGVQSATITNDKIDFTAWLQSRVQMAPPALTGTITASAQFSPADAGKIVRLGIWTSTLDGATIGSGASPDKVIPADGRISHTWTGVAGLTVFGIINGTAGVAQSVTLAPSGGVSLESGAVATYSAPLTNNDNHKAVAAADGNLVIATGAGVEAYLPSIPLRERLTARRPLPVYDPTRGVHRVTTADAASTPITVIPIVEGKAYSFRARIASVQYGGVATERAAYVVEGLAWRDVGGNVQVALHTGVPAAIEVTTTMDATGAVVTDTLRFNVVGKAATRMSWVNSLEWVDVGLGAAA